MKNFKEMVYGNLFETKLKNPKKADLNKDGELSGYEKKRGAAIEKSMAKQGNLEDIEYICKFILSVKRKDGKDFEPSSLRGGSQWGSSR